MIPLLSTGESVVVGGDEDSPSPDFGCGRSKDEVSSVEREEWYVRYRSLSKLLCCETCTVMLGVLKVGWQEVCSITRDVLLLWFGETLLLVL